jgi:AcrR family transcriptional regulator
VSEARRLGRPPSASGEETRSRLVHSARQCFAEFGYAGTSNRTVAEASGLTTGAIYHYFESKQQLYAAAYEGVQEHIYERFERVVLGLDSVYEELAAVLDEAVLLNRQDPSLARFLIARTTDVQRYPELSAVAMEPPQRAEFFGAMVRRAVERGDLRPERADELVRFIRVVTAGLVFAAAHDVDVQAAAAGSVKMALRGQLIEWAEVPLSGR